MFERELEEDIASATLAAKTAERNLVILLEMALESVIKTGGEAIHGVHDKA